MNKARLVKAAEAQQQQDTKPAPPQPRISRTGRLKLAVKEWVNEHREERQSVRQAFAALFAEN
ncbi:MAG TPA: hypothetical protein VEF04_03775 [Blastocatellia bacterium]|nr:hypothetical protein [Blastocatellia bacterium]